MAVVVMFMTHSRQPHPLPSLLYTLNLPSTQDKTSRVPLLDHSPVVMAVEEMT
jgi:hypothetical protein